MGEEGKITQGLVGVCPKRRYYIGPISSVPAGKKERVFFYKGRACIRQLNLFYNGDNTTGDANCKWTIKIDGETVINNTITEMYRYLAGWVISTHSDRPVVCTLYNKETNVFKFVLIDVGCIENGIEIWFENVDISNECTLGIGIAYDILE